MDRRSLGQIGILSDDGELVQCHCCGVFFGHLGAHVRRVHDLSPVRYREPFGLNRGTGLMGPALKQQRREHAQRHLAPVRLEALAWRSPRRASDASHRPESIRRLNSPPIQSLRAELGRIIWRWRSARGGTPVGKPVTPETAQRARARLERLRQDPSIRALMLANNAAAQRARAPHDSRKCVVCGSWFQTRPSSRKSTCNEQCRRIAQGLTALARSTRPVPLRW